MDDISAIFANVAENEATLPYLMARFYPQDPNGDLDFLDLDPTLVGST